MVRIALRCAAPALVLAALVLVPFLGKAFTSDDTLFLRQADHLLSDPQHPTAFEIVWTGSTAPERMSAIMPSGPAMAYFLVPCVRLGGREWIAHLEVLLFLEIAILATTVLALRLGCSAAAARAASLLLAATPAALAMASTAMPDVPAMALGVLGLERLVAWRDERRWHQALEAAAALALAALSRSHLVLVLGVAALVLPGDFLSWSRWRALPKTVWLPILATPLVILIVAERTRDPAAPSTALAGAAARYAVGSPMDLGWNVAAFAAHWTLALPLALPWAALRWRALLRQPFFYLVAGIAVWLFLRRGVAARQFFIIPAVALGAGVLWDVLGDAWRRRDALQLVLGLWLLLALPVAVYLHMPSKYLLASAPAAAILVGRALVSDSRVVFRTVLGASVVLGILLGILVVRADAAFAGLGRRAAMEMIAPNVAAGHHVWFDGHWGFQWYAEKAGANPLTTTPPLPLRGDLVVSSQRSFGRLIRMFPRRKRLATLEETEPGGRLMNADLGAGFYSNSWGLLPWAFGDEVLDRFDLWEVN